MEAAKSVQLCILRQGMAGHVLSLQTRALVAACAACLPVCVAW